MDKSIKHLKVAKKHINFALNDLTQNFHVISKEELRLALIRTDIGRYSTLGVSSLEEAECAIDADCEKLFKELNRLV